MHMAFFSLCLPSIPPFSSSWNTHTHTHTHTIPYANTYSHPASSLRPPSNHHPYAHSHIFKAFPELTADIKTGVYSQEDILTLVKYAYLRGIRVVPQIDVPGHSSGLIPLKPRGLTFCRDSPIPSCSTSQCQVGSDRVILIDSARVRRALLCIFFIHFFNSTAILCACADRCRKAVFSFILPTSR